MSLCGPIPLVRFVESSERLEMKYISQMLNNRINIPSVLHYCMSTSKFTKMGGDHTNGCPASSSTLQ